MKTLKKIWDRGIPLLNPLKDFLSISTVHGLSHIASARSLSVQIFWVLIVALSFCFAINLIGGSYVEWIQSPVSSVTTTKPISELDFPEVTVCPPKGSNTALNQVLEQVNEKKQQPSQPHDLKTSVREIFIERPSKVFARDLVHLMKISSWEDLFEGTVTISHEKGDADGERQILIQTSLLRGSFSTPGYNDTDYKGDFYKASQVIHFHIDLSQTSDEESLVINVEVPDGVKWQHSKQDKKLKLYLEKKTFHEAESFCEKLGGHQVSIGSESMYNEVLKIQSDIKGQNIWLGGTDEALEGNWTWTDGTPWSFNRWNKPEPNNGNIGLLSLGQGCISCGILVSGIGARGVSSEHMENMEMFSCSPTKVRSDSQRT